MNARRLGAGSAHLGRVFLLRRSMALAIVASALPACDHASQPVQLTGDAAVTTGSIAGDGPPTADAGSDLAVTLDSANAGPDAGVDLASDRATDQGLDAATDQGPATGDAAADAPSIVAADARPDLAADARPDLAVDAGPDLAADTGPDLAADAASDGPANVPLDSAPDAPPVVTPDVAPDVAPDASADLGVLLMAAPGGVMQDPSDSTTIELYGVDPGNQLVRRGGLGSAGIDPVDLGSPAGVTLVGTPAPLSWEKGRLDIFVRASDKFLHQRWFRAGSWQPWVTIGGVALSSDPSISSWGVERLDLFARGERDGDLQHLWYDHGWSPRWWESLGGRLGSAPSAIALAVGRIDIFARDPSNQLIHLAFDQNWLPWEPLGDTLVLGPAVTSRKPGIIEVYATGADHRLKRFEWTPTKRGAWKMVGLEVPGDFRVVTVAPRGVLVLSRLPSGELWQRSIDPGN